MALKRPITIDDDFEARERAQERLSVLLRDHGPPARSLTPDERRAVWQAIREVDALRTFRSSGLERFNHNHGRLPDGRALLVFQGEPVEQSPSLFFLVWGSEFGATFRAIVKLKQGPRQVALLPEDTAFEGFWSGRVVLAFLRLGKLEKAFELDYAARSDHAEALAYELALAADCNEKVTNAKSAFPSPSLALAYSWSTAFSREWTRLDWLQHGWITTAKNMLPRIKREMPEIAAACASVLTRSDLDPFPVLRSGMEVVTAAATSELQMLAIVDWLRQSTNAGLYMIECSEFFELRQNAGEEMATKTVTAITGIMNMVYMMELMPLESRFGRRQAYLDCTSRTLDGFDLAPEEFNIEADSDAQHYWNHKSFTMPFDAHLYLDPGDFPASPEEMARAWAPESIDIDVSAAEEIAGHLIDEASALKKWTIPSRARVEIKVGPFVAVELTEVHHEIYFVWRTGRNHYWPTSMGVRAHTYLIPSITGDDGDTKIAAELKLLMAALVRDFWVAEERHKIFDVTRRMEPSRGHGKSRKRVVYLPRIRYDTIRARLGAGFSAIAQGLNQAARSRHFVKHFFRRVEKPSPLQLVLARRQNIVVPEGHTYVQAHYRGGGESQVVYRSRSAMQLIFDTVDRPTLTKLAAAEDWFAFERMIGVLLEDHLGFKILQRAVRGRSDAGIDIVAIKATRIVNELWLIQCKHYGPDNPIGPSIVRELLGSMTDITPEDGQALRGMLVTTSRFTPDAVKLAVKHGIQVINGEDLVAICTAVNRQMSGQLGQEPDRSSV
jgi:hypothetical protein